MLQLPLLPNTSAYDMIVQLDGLSYRFAYQWNDRTASWYVSISTFNNEPILRQLRVVHKWPLYSRYRDPRLPPGMIFCVDMADSGQGPTFESMGVNTLLMYYTSADLESVALEDVAAGLIISPLP